MCEVFFKYLKMSVFFFVTAAFSAPQTPVRQYYPLPMPLPFSQAVRVGNTLYLSGLVGMDPKTGVVPPYNVEQEIRQIEQCMKEALAEAGMTMNDLVLMQVFCTDMNLYSQFNALTKSWFDPKRLPARTFAGVQAVPFGGRFEIQVIAVKD